MTADAQGPAPSAGSQTVQRAFEILRLVAYGQEGGVRLTDIVQSSGLNRPTVHRLLRTLIQENAVEQDPLTRRYRIGSELILLGIARTRCFPLLSMSSTHLLQLAQQVGDTVFLSIRHGNDSICIGRQTGHHPIQVLSIEVGTRRPLGVSVSGVALLATLPREESARITMANERRLALHQLKCEDVLDRIDMARKVGYAYAPIGIMPGTRAVAIPVCSDTGRPLAALTITAMSERLGSARLPQVLEQMQAQALQIAHHYDAVQTGGS